MTECKREGCDEKAVSKKEGKKIVLTEFCSNVCAKLHFLEMKRLIEEKIKWGFKLFIYTNEKKSDL